MESAEEINERELMQYYGFKGLIGNIRLKVRLVRSWVLQCLASASPSSGLAVTFQRARGVKIGNHVFIGPNVQIDLVYPHLVTIEDNVSIGMYSMIFAHSNPTCSIFLKKNVYPREIAPITIKKGAWIPPGTMILKGVTIGENSIVSAGSVVQRDVKPYTIVGGIPAKYIKDIDLPKN
jgi:acetyltransferase-like isoleucine patch superfamily enzyme